VRRVVVLFALVSACRSGPWAPARDHKNRGEYLAHLKLETVGVPVIDPDDILPRLGLTAVATREGTIDEYQLQLDTQRVAGAYQRLGYFSVDVKSKLEKLDKAYPDAATLVFVVTPGARAKVHLEFFGLPDDVPFPKVRDTVAIKEGSLFDYDQYDAAKDTLLLLFQDHGYAHVRLEGTVIADRAHAKATLRYVFDPGPRSTFGKVELYGIPEGDLADALRARIQWSEGEPFSHRALVDTQNELYALGTFGTVRVEPSEALDPIVGVKISVTRITGNDMSAGGGFGLEPDAITVRGRFTWTPHDLLPPLVKPVLDVRPEIAKENEGCAFYEFQSCKYDPRGRVTLTLTKLDLFRPKITGEVEGGGEYLVYEAYSRLSARGRLGIGAEVFTKELQVHAGWQYSVNTFPTFYVGESTVQELGIDHVNFVGAYTGSVTLDLRDDPIAPTYGLYAELRASVGTRLALGQYDYLQTTPDIRGYLPLLPHFVLAARVRLGTITGQVPATERYFGGGSASQRGFSSRQLSPFAASTRDLGKFAPIGGAGLFESSIELRTPPIITIKGFPITSVLFLDGGDVTFAASDLDLSNLHWATGVGLRLDVGIPIGVDVAYRLTRTNDDGVNPKPGERFNFLFAVGEAF
jgi:outer membrane protein assembly factor BamA